MEDFQIQLDSAMLVSLVGFPAVRRLGAFFSPHSIVKLRRVSATGQCINFHTDHSLRTLQVSLNDDFEGGELIYLTDEGTVHIPKRPAGTATVHDNSIVHGVGVLRSGIRYGLFLIQGFSDS